MLATLWMAGVAGSRDGHAQMSWFRRHPEHSGLISSHFLRRLLQGKHPDFVRLQARRARLMSEVKSIDNVVMGERKSPRVNGRGTRTRGSSWADSLSPTKCITTLPL
jgi:hypothetical protein